MEYLYKQIHVVYPLLNFLLQSFREINFTHGNNISIERSILEAINAGCNSAISIQTQSNLESENSQLIHLGKIYGVEKYISFSGTTAEKTINDIKNQDGLKLLNEHNWYSFKHCF